MDGSSLKWLIVGGMMLSRNDNIVAIASIALEPPSKWPVIDLIELIGIFAICSPNNWLIAIASEASPAGVEVPCVLIWSMSVGCNPADLRARCIHIIAPSPSG